MSERQDAPETLPESDEGKFISSRLVRFGDVDPAGIAYFPRIHNFIHEAFEDLWEQFIGVRYYQLMQVQRISFPMIHTEVDFKSPLRFGDRPRIEATCFHLGRSSLGIRYLFKVDGRLCVDARTTTACIASKILKTQPIPEEYRKYFEQIYKPLDEN
jgi:YbgC/YbaW family acyl-CoA thioester hydrolase